MDLNVLRKIRLGDIDKLEKDEENISNFIENHMVDECGLVYGAINADTLRPWTDNELLAYDLFSPAKKGPADFTAYEDSLMATGEYALGQLIKYQVTQDPKALTTASQQVYAILRVLYEGELYEKGYLPKPYGGIRKASYSHEISPDQYIKAYIALRAYQPYAPKSLNRTIDSYLVAIADYFLIRGFSHPYFESAIVSPKSAHHSTSIYIPSLFIAYKITGDKKYLDPINSRFDDALKVLSEKKYGGFNICSLLCEGFSLSLKEGLDDERLKDVIKKLWEFNIPQVSSDGLGYIYEDITDENQCEPFLGEFKKKELNLENAWRFIRWRSNGKTSMVLRLPSLASIVDEYFPETEAYKMGLFILDKVKDPKMMLDFNDTDGKQLLPEHRYLAKTICGIGISSWVLAYWRLRDLAGKRVNGGK